MKIKHFKKLVGMSIEIRVEYCDHVPLYVGEACRIPGWIAAKKLIEIRAAEKAKFILIICEERGVLGTTEK